ncbi:MAG TPA: hypothetical protein VF292_02740 [Rhodanobacteraceae bacterium]
MNTQSISFDQSFQRNATLRPNWFPQHAPTTVAECHARDLYRAILGLPRWKHVFLSDALSPGTDCLVTVSPSGHCRFSAYGTPDTLVSTLARMLHGGGAAWIASLHHQRSLAPPRHVYLALLGHDDWSPVSPSLSVITGNQSRPHASPTAFADWPANPLPLAVVCRAYTQPLSSNVSGALHAAHRISPHVAESVMYRHLLSDRASVLRAARKWGAYAHRLGCHRNAVRGLLLDAAHRGVPDVELQRFDDLASGTGQPLNALEAAVVRGIARLAWNPPTDRDVAQTCVARILATFTAGSTCRRVARSRQFSLA